MIYTTSLRDLGRHPWRLQHCWWRTPEPGKEESVCSLVLVETDPGTADCEVIHKSCLLISCNLIRSLCVDKHFYDQCIIIIIHPVYAFAFIERSCAVSQL